MLSILIVDDDPLLCAAMRRKIQIVDQGNGLGVQEVAAAHSVQEAWDLLRSRPINVLISDIQPFGAGFGAGSKPFPSGNSAGGVKWL